MEFFRTLLVIVAISLLCGFLALGKVKANEAPLHCQGMTRAADDARCGGDEEKPQPPPEQPARKTGGSAHTIESGEDHSCHKPGGDCIEYAKASGAYCHVAAQLAGDGAYLRLNEKLSLEEAKAKMPALVSRPYTKNEREHIAFWITWGWSQAVNHHNYVEVAWSAYGHCMTRKES